jgi:hypothetical protein
MNPYRFRNFVVDVLLFAVFAAISNTLAILWVVWIGIRTYQRYGRA